MLEAALLVAGGVAAGAVLAVLAGRGGESLLFGLSPTDVITFAHRRGAAGGDRPASPALVPALRASRVDPMLALRQD